MGSPQLRHRLFRVPFHMLELRSEVLYCKTYHKRPVWFVDVVIDKK